MLIEQVLYQYRHPVLVVSTNKEILFANGAACDVLGISGGTSLALVLKGNQQILEGVDEVLKTGSRFSYWDVSVPQVDQSTKKYDLDLFAIYEEASFKEGALKGIALFFYDRSLSAPLKEHRQRGDRLGDLTAIASGLAHEIRNPLSGIKGAAELLAESLKDNQELCGLTHILKDEVIRINRLVTQLLDMTKPRSLQLGQVNINAILHEMIQFYKGAGDTQGCDFIEDLDISLPTIQADADALKQIFLNLLKNACEAQKGQGTVTIKTRIVTDFVLKRGTKRSPLIVVDVVDYGPGLKEEDLDRIFVPFYSTKSQGSGLGLAICQQLVEQQGGSLKVKSVYGRGCTFSVLLPLEFFYASIV